MGLSAVAVRQRLWALTDKGRFSAVVVLALFALVGVLVVDDYGVAYDESVQRALAAVTTAYMIGADDALLSHRDRTYGVAFELPLLFIELALGLDDLRSVHLMRHTLSHFFFLLGGFFCYLLVRRMGGGRLLALFAMLLFLLHPRIWAHSFFNTKDVPFLSMFMITLFLIHRAFRKDDFAAFLSCGVAVGLLTNIRILGVMLFAAVLGMRLLDLFHAADGRERKHALVTVGLFATASAGVLYATWPYLWSDPLGHFAHAFARMADHPEVIHGLFQGEQTVGSDIPPQYVVVWLSITSPGVALLLGGLGLAVTLRRILARPSLAWKRGLRFEFLLTITFLLPLLAVVLLDSNLYNGWRQMYFLYAPIVLLAAIGLRSLVAIQSNAMLRTAACGLAAAGLTATVAAMAFLHPNQPIYFNFLVDRKTPERLSGQFDIDYYETTFRQGLEWLLKRDPASTIHVDTVFNEWNSSILPKRARHRVDMSFQEHADYYVTNHRQHTTFGTQLNIVAPLVHSLKVYNNTVMSVAALDLSLAPALDLQTFRKLHQTATTGVPIVRANYNLYLKGGSLVYSKDECRPLDSKAHFILHIEPASQDDLREHGKSLGFDVRAHVRFRGNRDFRFGDRGVRFDSKCLLTVPLPEYEIAAVTVGQSIPTTDKFGGRNECYVWKEVILFGDGGEARRCPVDSPRCAGRPPMPRCSGALLPSGASY